MTPGGQDRSDPGTGSAWTEDSLRAWLVDYLIGTLECSRAQIDSGASMHDLGVGSRDAVVLTRTQSVVP